MPQLVDHDPAQAGGYLGVAEAGLGDQPDVQHRRVDGGDERAHRVGGGTATCIHRRAGIRWHVGRDAGWPIHDDVGLARVRDPHARELTVQEFPFPGRDAQGHERWHGAARIRVEAHRQAIAGPVEGEDGVGRDGVGEIVGAAAAVAHRRGRLAAGEEDRRAQEHPPHRPASQSERRVRATRCTARNPRKPSSSSAGVVKPWMS